MKNISIIIAGIIAVVLFGRFLLRQYFGKQVERLYLGFRGIEKYIDFRDLKGLPLPVEKYFRTVLKEGMPYIKTVRTKHEGVFKTRLKSSWGSIKGEQYFIAARPGFVWKGRTKIYSATDSYIEGKGKFKLWLFSIIPVVNRAGDRLSHTELLRWLGETVWFPTALLSDESLSWKPIDDVTAKLIYDYNGKAVVYIVHFSERNVIWKFECMRPDRFGKLRKWEGLASAYQWHNDFYIPTKVEAAWIFEGLRCPYAEFELTRIEYNIPHKFND